MRVEREHLLISCSEIVFSCSLAICTLAYPDPRENVEQPHPKDMPVHVV